jgi:hypothetical protein
MLIPHLRHGLILAAGLLTASIGCSDNSNPANWKKVSHAPFHLKMPGEPQRTDQQLPSPAGLLKVSIYQHDKGDHVYGFAATSYPPQVLAGVEPQTTLEGSREGQINAMPGQKLLASKHTEYRGYPAIEFSYEGSVADKSGKKHKMTSYTRTVLAGNHLIAIMYFGLPESVSQQQAITYYDTLEIDGGAAPSGTAKTGP